MEWDVTFTLGTMLVGALLAGMVADWFQIPKVTAYLLVGMVLGPSVFDQIPHDHTHSIEPLARLAICLVLFNLGCHFPIKRVRRIIGRVLRLSFGELSVTFLLVAVGLILLGEGWEIAVLLGALALATAPATTILVLKEAESEGPVTEYTQAMVTVNNLVCIVVFELLFLFVELQRGTSGVPTHVPLRDLAQDLIGSIAMGAAAGLALSYSITMLDSSRRLVLIMATSAVLLGICMAIESPYLLGFLVMGGVVANTSELTEEILAELDRLTGLLCVVFFVIHGAEISLDALMQMGQLGVAYLILRTIGKYVGTTLAARAGREVPAVQRYLGFALVAQAGAAIALASIAKKRDPELGSDLETVILGTVVVFELVGPLLIRWAVLKAGEVPLVHAIRHHTVRPLDELANWWRRLVLRREISTTTGRRERKTCRTPRP